MKTVFPNLLGSGGVPGSGPHLGPPDVHMRSWEIADILIHLRLIKGTMSRICRLQFVNTTFKVGSSSLAERHPKHLPAGESQPKVGTSFVHLVFPFFQLPLGCELTIWDLVAIGRGLLTAQKVEAQKRPEQSNIRKYRQRAGSVKTQTSSGSQRDD